METRDIASLESEEQVLGALLVHPARALEGLGALTAGDFHYPAPRAVFAAIVEAIEARDPVDAVVVLERMRSNGTVDQLRQQNGLDYLTHLMAGVVTVEGVGFHAATVARKARRRRVAHRLRQLAVEGFDVHQDDDDYLMRIESEILEIARDAPDSQAIVPMKDVAHAWLAEYERKAIAAEEGRPERYVPTGVRQFDAYSGGLRPGEVLTIAARPGRGKTALMNFTLRAAALEAVPALCVSYEMPPADLVERMVSGEGGIEGTRLRVPKVSAGVMTRVFSAAARASQWPIDFLARPDMTVDEMRSHARRWRSEHTDKNALIAIDYAQIVKAGLKSKNVNREREVAYVCEQIDAMAMELACAVVMLAQINREADKRGGKPKMSDLRESGQIEAVSDVIWGIYVPDLDECDAEDARERPAKCTAYLLGLKGRSVPGGALRMCFEPPYTRFSNPED